MADKYAHIRKEIKKGQNAFQSKYAAFTGRLRYNNNGNLEIFAVKTSKAKDFPWGFSGGKEEIVDKENIFLTSRREYLEETTMEDPNRSEIFFKLKRKNNSSIGEFANYFLVSFQEIEPTTRPKLVQKESVVGMSWGSLSEFENLSLKQNHRIAFVELCYWLQEKHAKNDPSIARQLSKCSYQVFERPSITGCVLRFKYDEKSKSTETARKSLPFLINPKLFEGFKIYKNPMEGYSAMEAEEEEEWCCE